MQSVPTLGQVCHFVSPAEVLRGVTVAENHLFRCWTQRRLSLFLALLSAAIHITQCTETPAPFSSRFARITASERAIIEWNPMIIFQINLKASPAAVTQWHQLWVCLPEPIPPLSVHHHITPNTMSSRPQNKTWGINFGANPPVCQPILAHSYSGGAVRSCCNEHSEEILKWLANISQTESHVSFPFKVRIRLFEHLRRGVPEGRGLDT